MNRMTGKRGFALAAICAALVLTSFLRSSQDDRPLEETPASNARALIERGREAFRHSTFGDERFWGGRLRLHEAIAGDENGGVGPGLAPADALELGLKVDLERLPLALRQQIAAGQVNLNDPAVTLALLRLDSVVGVRGFFDASDQITSVGITCALCHSTVDDRFAPGIGNRLDGWPNRDLDVGSIIAFAPDLTFFSSHLGVPVETVEDVLHSWGPGKFDAHLLLDGKAFQPSGETAATLLPAAFGLGGVNLHTYVGWGGISHWNAFVAVLEMQGQGTLYEPRLRDATRFPLAAAAGFDDVRPASGIDQVTDKLAALQLYQLALPVPKPPPGSFDAAAAERGKRLFAGAADCARCHVPPIFTEPGTNLHTADEIGIDDFQAQRGPVGMYRTTPLRGLFTRAKGGFYHDGRFETLFDVVEHYDELFHLGLTPEQKSDIVEYLKSL
jgi:hypothetical protein